MLNYNIWRKHPGVKLLCLTWAKSFSDYLQSMFFRLPCSLNYNFPFPSVVLVRESWHFPRVSLKLSAWGQPISLFELNFKRKTLLCMVKPVWQNHPHCQSICLLPGPWWNPWLSHLRTFPEHAVSVHYGIISSQWVVKMLCYCSTMWLILDGQKCQMTYQQKVCEHLALEGGM